MESKFHRSPSIRDTNDVTKPGRSKESKFLQRSYKLKSENKSNKLNKEKIDKNKERIKSGEVQVPSVHLGGSPWNEIFSNRGAPYIPTTRSLTIFSIVFPI
ncbi:uncharacterized protein LOC143143491 [Ptiloglossa arizonensis]|uniref:uncharacterized protein LOC143143491 n=1 Tax=Ptiloglossa arizonensis TaxID=3350558 RepID=UPI003F9FBA4E